MTAPPCGVQLSVSELASAQHSDCAAFPPTCTEWDTRRKKRDMEEILAVGSYLVEPLAGQLKRLASGFDPAL